MPSEINASELHDFFDAFLHASVVGKYSNNGPEVQKFCVSAFIDRETGDIEHCFYNYPDTNNGFINLITDIANNSDAYDTYFAPALYKSRDDGNGRVRIKGNVADEIGVLWADLDACNPLEVSPKPSIAWETSPNRYQAAWLLNQTIAKANVEKLNRKIAYAYRHLGADVSGWPSNKILRVPGTPNLKYNDKPIVKILWHEDTKYSAEDFEFLPEPPPLATFANSTLPPQVPVDERYEVRVETFVDKINNKILIGDFIKKGEKGKSFSDARFNLLCSFLEVGLPHSMLKAATKKCLAFDENTNFEADWNNAFGKHPHEEQTCSEYGNCLNPRHESKLTINKQSDKAPEDDDIDVLIGKMLDCDQLDSLPIPTSLVEDMKDMDSVNWVVGKSGDGKSFCTISLAAAIGGGIPWMGKRVRQGQVVYIAAEGSNGIKLRKRAWEIEHQRKMTGVLFLPMPVQAVNVLKGMVSYEWKVLAAACKKLGAVYIVIDTQARATVGVEENSSTQMGIFIDAAELLRRETRACIDIVHHLGRGNSDRGRGSSSLDAAAETEIKVSSERIKHPEGYTKRITISSNKQKERDDFDDMKFYLKIIDLGMVDDWGKPLSSCVLIPIPPDEKDLADVESDKSAKGMTVNLPIPIDKLKEHFSDGSFSNAALNKKIQVLISVSKATADRRIEEMIGKTIKEAPDSKSNNKHWEWIETK